MRRLSLIAIFAILTANRAIAQDMPLSQILIEGEGWHQGSGEDLTAILQVKKIPDVEKPTCHMYSPDGGTLFVGSEIGTYIWAFRVEKDGSLTAGQPYCPLRVLPGQKNMPVSKLAIDGVGRIYAATSVGIQVFDPTGRLCGVIDNPPSGPVEDMDCVVKNDQLCVHNKGGTYL